MHQLPGAADTALMPSRGAPSTRTQKRASSSNFRRSAPWNATGCQQRRPDRRASLYLLANSSIVSLQNASVRPCGVLQDRYAGSLMLAALVRNCACSEPTTLPWASYSSTGALPATPAWPTARRMGGNPDAVTVNGAFTAHVFPGSA